MVNSKILLIFTLSNETNKKMKKEKIDWLEFITFILCFVFIFFSIFSVVKGIRNNATDFELTLYILNLVIWFGTLILRSVDKLIRNLENKKED